MEELKKEFLDNTDITGKSNVNGVKTFYRKHIFWADENEQMLKDVANVLGYRNYNRSKMLRLAVDWFHRKFFERYNKMNKGE